MCIISNIRGKSAIVFKRSEQIGLLTLVTLKKYTRSRSPHYARGGFTFFFSVSLESEHGPRDGRQRVSVPPRTIRSRVLLVARRHRSVFVLPNATPHECATTGESRPIRGSNNRTRVSHTGRRRKLRIFEILRPSRSNFRRVCRTTVAVGSP